MRQSLEQVPGNAGPLNSSSLVHRSLSLMRELSPGYLQQFLSYVDALSWMEQMNGGSASAKRMRLVAGAQGRVFGLERARSSEYPAVTGRSSRLHAMPTLGGIRFGRGQKREQCLRGISAARTPCRPQPRKPS